jgi:type I restriction enzyme M protein
LGGLEAVELRFSQILEDNDSFRFDSEYFKKEYLQDLNVLYKTKPNKLKTITTKISVGYVGSMVDEYSDNGIILLQTKNIDEIFINEKDFIKINNKFHDKLKKSQIKYKDILIARSGSFGKASIYLFEDIINTSDIIIIKANENLINSYYLTTFLNTNYGKNQLIRFASGGLQGHVNLTILENLYIPNLKHSFQIEIENLINLAHKKLENKKNLYKESENLLLKELDLLNFEPTQENISIKSFSESFGITGRIDSEYYLPKYIQYIEILKNYKYSWKPIQEVLTNDIKSGTTPKSIIKKYIPNSNYFFRAEAFNSDLTLTYENLYSMSDEVFENYPNITVKQNDILVSMTGSIGSVAVVTKKIDGIINQNIVKLSVNQEIINHNVLALYIKIIGKTLLRREQTGNVQPYVNISNFSNLIVPLIDKKIQTQIEDKIKESFRLKEESKELLELAKRGVEMAIEEGEEVALEFIGDNKKWLKI